MSKTTVARLDDLKRKAEQLRQEHDRAQGRLDESQARLREEFGVKDLDEAKALLRESEEKRQKADNEFHTVLDEVETKWNEVFGG